MSARLDRTEIQTILPHREPFLFVDAVTEIEADQRIVGELTVDDRRPWLAARGEERCLSPTILAEAMGQVGAILVLFPDENRGKTIFFRSIDECEFMSAVPKGKTVRIEAEVRRMRARFGSLAVEAKFDEHIAARAVMSFALV